MKPIKVIINGEPISTLPDKTILEVVREHNLDDIPTLCHDDRLEPFGSCFLCVVEIEGFNRLMPSCATKVSEGMVIQTDNDRIRSSRKTALELLLSNHYADCIGPCIDACPAHVDVQGYIALISMGKYREALALVKEKNPMPLSLGRVCVRNCEDNCRRQCLDESVAINSLKRYIADLDSDSHWTPVCEPSTGKKVAVIGGGPSGLTCSYYLTLKGHDVTIFEKLPELGGMLRYGIPEYRLPEDVLNDEINWMLGLGIRVQTNVNVGKDITVEKIMSQGFDAVYLSVGAQKASLMRLDHEDDTDGVTKGIDFLRAVQQNEAPELKGTVAVVGGGNTAIDAARTALRCGAEKVIIIYRRSVKEMPAAEEEINAAYDENIHFEFLTLPVRIVREGNKLKSIDCVRMELLEGREGERPRPVPVNGSEFNLPLDFLISAIGQQVDTAFLTDSESCDMEKWGTVKVNEDTQETSVPGIFAGGDVVSGPLTAIMAIAQGRRASESIAQFLNDDTVKSPDFNFYSFKHRFNTIAEREFTCFEKIPREKMPELTLDQRVCNFNEVELGFTDSQSKHESERCLECGCSQYYDCDLRKYADRFEVDINDFIGEVRKHDLDKSHPFISLDPNKCINCGKCVRTCSEMLQVSALGFVYRGFNSVVKPSMEHSLLDTNCISCGNCIDVCPTGAISEQLPHKALGILKKHNHQSICQFCSMGCAINYKIVDDQIFHVENSVDSVKHYHNQGYLCSKGRFAHRYFMSEKRLTHPLILNGHRQTSCSWDEAMSMAADRLTQIMDQYGSEAVAVFASPSLSNEELYLLQKFARVGLKNNNIHSLTNMLYGVEQNCLNSSLGVTTSTASMDDIEKADIIVMMNSSNLEENLITELKIKKAQKQGSRFILFNSSEIKLTQFADLWIDNKKGTSTAIMNGIAKEFIQSPHFNKDIIENDASGLEQLEQMVAPFGKNRVLNTSGITISKYDTLLQWLLEEDKKVLFIYNVDSWKEKSPNDLQSIVNFLILSGRLQGEGNGLILTREYVNSSGLANMGISPEYLPGQTGLDDKQKIQHISGIWNTSLDFFKHIDLKERMTSGTIKAALVFGEDPLSITENRHYFENLQFLMVSDSFETHTTAEADLVLPACTSMEQEGSYTSCDGIIQFVSRLFENKHGCQNWQTICQLADNFSAEFKYSSFSEISKEIEQVNYLYYNESVIPDLTEFRPVFSIFRTQYDTINPTKPTILASERFYRNQIRNMLRS